MPESLDESLDLVAPGADEHVAVAGPLAAPGEEPVRRRRLTLGAWIAIAWLVVVTAAALLAPVLPLEDPAGGGIETLRNPSVSPFEDWSHPFGTDDLRRDVLSRVVWGARTSLVVGVGSILVGTLVGGALGLIAGYKGRVVDTVFTGGFNILLAFPQLVLAITLVSVLSPQSEQDPPTWGERVLVMILSIGIVSIPILGRITRANTMAWSQREFVMAARAQGATGTRTMVREVLPNVLPAMLSIALLGIAIVIVVEGGLALFGLSVPSGGTPSWGVMISAQIDKIADQPYIWQFPAVAIFFTVLALNYLGDFVRAQFDVRESVL